MPNVCKPTKKLSLLPSLLLLLLLLLPSHLGAVWIHVVIDVLRHLILRGEASPAVGHGAAERTIALANRRDT